jgi:hypothetical protein
MADRDPRTVFVANSAKLAEAVIELLAAHNIPAEIEPPPPPESSALTGYNEPPPAEFPVLVTDPTKVNDANELLAAEVKKMADLRAVIEKRASRTGTITAPCEDCGRASEWPATAMGTTEVCPHCGAYMDIPDPDEDWSDVDFGEAEGEDNEGAK